jgi:predicted alpha/beta hydrolase family esterase
MTRRWRGAPWVLALAIALAIAVVAVAYVAWPQSTAAPYTPRDPALLAQPLFFYPATDTTKAAKAFVFFFGNDIGFWGAHQELASRLAGEGYDVVGLDVKKFYATLPSENAARERAFADSVVLMIARARHELHADSLPVIIGGHSIGAEVASWIVSRTTIPGLVGALLIAPGARGHLRVAVSDLTMSGEPEEPGSFSVAENIRTAPPALRFAIVRGTDDRYRTADSALLVAGASRIDKWSVPWGGHSMSNIILAGPFVERAVSWLLSGSGSGSGR